MDSLKDNPIAARSLARVRLFLKNRCFGVISSERSSQIENEIRQAGFGFLLIKDLADPNECKGYLVLGSVGRVDSALASFLANYNADYRTDAEEMIRIAETGFYTSKSFFSRQESLF